MGLSDGIVVGETTAEHWGDATGTRRTTGFRIARENTVDLVGSCGEGRVRPFIPPVQDLGSNIYTLPSCPSSPDKPSRSCISEFTTQISGISHFLAHLRLPVQTQTTSRSAGFRSSSPVLRRGLLPRESIQMRYTLNATVSPRVDFVQDLYLKELKV